MAKPSKFVPDELLEELGSWADIKDKLAALRKQEVAMRLSLVERLIAVNERTEGTHTFSLPNNYKLKVGLKLSRDIDVAMLDNLRLALKELGIPVDSLIRMKPELSKRDYNELTAEQQNLFDQILIIKDGLPDLSIEAPKPKTEKL